MKKIEKAITLGKIIELDQENKMHNYIFHLSFLQSLINIW